MPHRSVSGLHARLAEAPATFLAAAVRVELAGASAACEQHAIRAASNPAAVGQLARLLGELIAEIGAEARRAGGECVDRDGRIALVLFPAAPRAGPEAEGAAERAAVAFAVRVAGRRGALEEVVPRAAVASGAALALRTRGRPPDDAEGPLAIAGEVIERLGVAAAHLSDGAAALCLAPELARIAGSVAVPFLRRTEDRHYLFRAAAGTSVPRGPPPPHPPGDAGPPDPWAFLGDAAGDPERASMVLPGALEPAGFSAAAVLCVALPAGAAEGAPGRAVARVREHGGFARSLRWSGGAFRLLATWGTAWQAGMWPGGPGDGPYRACAAAASVLAELGGGSSAGVATGTLFSGSLGTAADRCFCCAGAPADAAEALALGAGPGEVLLDAETARAVAGWLRAEPLGDAGGRRYRLALDVGEGDGEGDDEGDDDGGGDRIPEGAAREEVLDALRGEARCAPLVGMAAERDAIAEIVADARAAAGPGRALRLVGGPGSGKTALLTEACRLARFAGVRAIRVRPGPRPLRALPQLRGTRTLLVVDDAHALDAASAAAIEAIVLGGAVHAAIASRTVRDPGGAKRISPLVSTRHARAMIAAEMGADEAAVSSVLAERILAASGGLPGPFRAILSAYAARGLVEVDNGRVIAGIALLDETEGGSVRGGDRARAYLDRLPPAEATVARICAAAGPAFETAQVIHASGRAGLEPREVADALAALERHGLLVRRRLPGDVPAHAFAEPHVALALRRTLSVAEARACARLCAEYLLRTASLRPAEEAAEAALQYERAGDAAMRGLCADAAAFRAARCGRYRAALALCRPPPRVCPPPRGCASRGDARAWQVMSRALCGLGRTADAESAARACIAHARRCAPAPPGPPAPPDGPPPAPGSIGEVLRRFALGRDAARREALADLAATRALDGDAAAALRHSLERLRGHPPPEPEEACDALCRAWSAAAAARGPLCRGADRLLARAAAAAAAAAPRSEAAERAAARLGAAEAERLLLLGRVAAAADAARAVAARRPAGAGDPFDAADAHALRALACALLGRGPDARFRAEAAAAGNPAILAAACATEALAAALAAAAGGSAGGARSRPEACARELERAREAHAADPAPLAVSLAAAGALAALCFAAGMRDAAEEEARAAAAAIAAAHGRERGLAAAACAGPLFLAAETLERLLEIGYTSRVAEARAAAAAAAARQRAHGGRLLALFAARYGARVAPEPPAAEGEGAWRRDLGRCRDALVGALRRVARRAAFARPLALYAEARARGSERALYAAAARAADEVGVPGIAALARSRIGSV